MLREIDQIDILLARIMYDIKTKQNFSKSEASLTNIINKKFTETRQNEILLNSPRFKLRLFKMYSRILLQNGEFLALQDFLLTSLEKFNKEIFFNRNNHEEKLTLLTYLVNCSYKNKQHNLSLKYAEKLRKAMSEFDAFCAARAINIENRVYLGGNWSGECKYLPNLFAGYAIYDLSI